MLPIRKAAKKPHSLHRIAALIFKSSSSLPYGRITYTGSKGRALRPLSHVRICIRRIAPLAVDAIFVYNYSKPVALVKEETPCIRTFLRI